MTLVHVLALIILAGPFVGNLVALLLRSLGYTKAAAVVVQLTPFAVYGVQFVDAEIERKPLPKPPTLPGIGMLLAVAILISGCSSAPTGAQIATGITAGEDLGDAVCAVLEGIPQTDTTVTQFICSQVPKPGSTTPPKTFRIRVKAADAPAFAEAHCVKSGSGAPTP